MAETRYAARFRRVVAALRARGFTVVEEPGCYSRTVGQGTSKAKDFIQVRSHVPHHTAGGNDSSDRRVVRDGREGLRGPLSQFLTETDGVLRLLATGYANHAGPTRRRYEGNSYSVGNEIVSRGRSERDFSPAQVAAAEALAEELAREFGYDLASWTVGHKEIAVPSGRKVDPAFSMPGFRSRLSLSRGGGTPHPTTPTPDPEDWFDMVSKAELSELIDERLDAHRKLGHFKGLTDGEAEQANETHRAARSADTNATAVRQTLQPGGLIHDVLRNTEAVAARGKNLTIELLGGVAAVLQGVGKVPAQTVAALVSRLSRASEDEPVATPLPARPAAPAVTTREVSR